MIFHFDTGTLIVTPPKTGSSTLHSHLCGRRDYHYVIARTCWGKVSKHCSLDEIGENPSGESEIDVRRVLLCVRHPVDRLLSMYRHQFNHDGLTWPFARWTQHHDANGGPVCWQRSCRSHLSDRQPDGVLRLEHLSDDLVRHGFPPTSIHRNARDRNVAAEPSNAMEICLATNREEVDAVARRWWPEDFVDYPGSGSRQDFR